MVKKLGGKAVEIFLNLRLVVGQINGELEARDQRMQGYLNKAWRLQSSFGSFYKSECSQKTPELKGFKINRIELNMPWKMGAILVNNQCL